MLQALWKPVATHMLVSALLLCLSQYAFPQGITVDRNSNISRIDSLQLSPAKEAQLRAAISTHDYIAAEKILLPAIMRCHDNTRKALLLEFTGGIYYLSGDYLHAAVAWNKSAAIAPLPATLQFSLAMAYLQLNRPDWARNSLQSLARRYPANALYPYWLGRLDYDSHLYNKAIRYFQQSIHLAPRMARAYDNLGLCYYYLNQNTQAILYYKKAIELNLQSNHPSAWPYLNLAITQEFLGQLNAAEANLKQSIGLNPKIPTSYLQLGDILEHQGKLQQALREYQKASHLDKNYAEPHFALARIYKRLGENSLAHAEVRMYLQLRREKAPVSSVKPSRRSRSANAM